MRDTDITDIMLDKIFKLFKKEYPEFWFFGVKNHDVAHLILQNSNNSWASSCDEILNDVRVQIIEHRVLRS